MKIALYNAEKDEIVAEFKVEIDKHMFIARPVIHDEKFEHLTEDLLFVRAKWMTRYLNYSFYDKTDGTANKLELGMIADIEEMLNKEGATK
jgi:hypothetical protein